MCDGYTAAQLIDSEILDFGAFRLVRNALERAREGVLARGE